MKGAGMAAESLLCGPLEWRGREHKTQNIDGVHIDASDGARMRQLCLHTLSCHALKNTHLIRWTRTKG